MNYLNELKLNPDNPRKVSEIELLKLKESIKGFPEMLEKRPIVYDDDLVILGGNTKFLVLQGLAKEGFEIKDSYFQSAEGWTEAQKREFVLKDNLHAGDWDKEILQSSWNDLPLNDWGIDTSNFKKEIIEDEAPQIQTEIVSKVGEVYQLGRHRLTCGDSTNYGDLVKLMNDNKADLVFTDPPFNLSYGGTGKHNKFSKQFIAGDNITDEAFVKFLDEVNANIKAVVKETASIYEWIDFRQISKLYEVMKKYFYIDQMIVWDKTFIKLGGNYRNQHEFMLYGYGDINDGDTPYVSLTDQCIYAKNNKKLAKWFGGRSQSNIWYKITDPTSTYRHPTQKPVELPARAIQNSSAVNDIVLDVFGGSGSTLIACEQLDRISYNMELDPQYCDVIRRRYAKFKGIEDWQRSII